MTEFKQLQRNQKNAQDDINENFSLVATSLDNVSEKVTKLETADTGWKNFAGKNTAFYRVLNNVLYIKFENHNPTDKSIGTLPTEYVPITPAMVDIAGWTLDSTKKARLQINGKNQGDPGKVEFVSQNVDTLRAYLPGIPLG